MNAVTSTLSIVTFVASLMMLIPRSPVVTIVRFLIVAPFAPSTLIARAAVDVRAKPLPSSVIALLITTISLAVTSRCRTIVSPSLASSRASSIVS